MLVSGHAIGEHADLRKVGDLVGQILGGLSNGSNRYHAVGEADRERFLRVNGAAGYQHVHRSTLPDQAR